MREDVDAGMSPGAAAAGLRHVLAGVPLALACALALALALRSAPALAVKTRPLQLSIGTQGHGDSQFEGPVGVAVREPTLSEPAEDVYVADRGNNRIEQFSSSGAFIAAWGWGVSDGRDQYEVCTSNCRQGIASEGQFDSPEWIAVDNSTSPLDPSAGDVYVANAADNAIEKFSPNGAYIGQVTASFGTLYGIGVDSGGELWVYQSSGAIENFSDAEENELIASREDPRGTNPGFAVDSEDNLYVHTGAGGIAKVSSSGTELIYGLDGEESTAVAVALATNEVYVGNVTTVAEFNSSGEFLGRFGHLSGTGGIAASSAAGAVYVADTAANILDVFAAPAMLPAVAVEAASSVQKKPGTIEATLNGSVDPEGEAVTGCYFEYGPSLPSGKTAPCEPAPGAAAGPVAVHATVSRLLPSTTYLYRVVAGNANGSNTSATEAFQTPIVVTVAIAAASVVKRDGTIEATLNGSVDPEGEAIPECYFEYGPSLPSGKTAPCEPAPGSAAGPVEVHATLSKLPVATVFHYRIVAETQYGPRTSAEADLETPPAVAGVTKCSASDLLNEGATLHGSLDPQGLATSWLFEYRKAETAEPWSMTAEVDVEHPTARDVEVEDGLSGLARNTTYECRLVARNVYGSTTSTEGVEKEPEEAGNFEFTTALPPEVEGESVSAAGFSSVTMDARIDGFGAADSFRFEYGTSESYGSSTPEVTLQYPVRGEAPVYAQVVGLQPSTTYHLRIVVTEPDGGGTAIGPDVQFKTFPETSAQLPDGRVYEMVSPVEAQGANVYVPEAHNGPFPVPTELPFQASADGEAVAYAGAPAAGGNGNAGAGGGNEFAAALTPGGWVSQDLMPPGSSTPAYLAFSPDLSVGILESREPLALGAPGGGYDVLYGATLGGVHALFSQKPEHRSAEEFASAGTLGPRGPGLAYAGASADFGHLLFEANDALAPEAEGQDPGAQANDLYDSVGGQPSLVNVLPASEGGGPAPDATFGAPQETASLADPPDFSDVISADGSRVFWTDLHAGPEEGHLYVRENGTSTVAVSPGAARFWTATPDGRYAFYTEGAGLESRLYRFDVEDEATEELTRAGAGVLGVVGASEDGEYVYFVAEGDLAANAKQGEPNLYLLHEGETRLVATLSPEDEGGMAYGSEGGSFGDWEPGLGHRTAEVTPDGHSVVFQSVRPLTGYESEGLSEVFVYDAEAGGGLFCASCDQSGEPPPVSEIAGVRVKAAAYLPVSWSRTYMPRVISEDGSQVFFDSFEPLVSADPNGQQDVYEWERDGAGTCREPQGCQYLLSGGTSRSGSYLLDASANGDSVFFVSDARLVAQDDDESDHLYDDRVGGVQPSAPAGCAGAECREVPIAPPIFATPPSATFAGVGNFQPAVVVPTQAKAKPKHRRHKSKGEAGKHVARRGKKSDRAKRSSAKGRRAGARRGRS
jgi:hypothetical protein